MSEVDEVECEVYVEGGTMDRRPTGLGKVVAGRTFLSDAYVHTP